MTEKKSALERAKEKARAAREVVSGPAPPPAAVVVPGARLEDLQALESMGYKFAANKINAVLLHKFLGYFRTTGLVSKSCKLVGICPSTINRLRQANPQFAELYEAARMEATEMLEDEARRRAYEGYEEPIFYKGEEVAQVRRYSDKLLEFLLTYNNPAKFGGNQKHRGGDDAPGTGAGLQVNITLFSNTNQNEVKTVELTAGKTKDDNNTAVRVETPRVSDASLELFGERGEKGGDSLAPAGG